MLALSASSWVSSATRRIAPLVSWTCRIVSATFSIEDFSAIAPLPSVSIFWMALVSVVDTLPALLLSVAWAMSADPRAAAIEAESAALVSVICSAAAIAPCARLDWVCPSAVRSPIRPAMSAISTLKRPARSPMSDSEDRDPVDIKVGTNRRRAAMKTLI